MSAVSKARILFLAACWTSVAMTAAELAPIPEVIVPRVAAPLVIDGQWGDKWRDAVSIPMHAFWSPEKMTVKDAEVRVSYDARYLYVGFRCVDDNIVTMRTAPDDQTYRDDCVEVFLAQDRERLPDALGLEISASGVVADFYYRHSDWFHYGWDSFVEVKSSRTGEGYIVEMAIPWRTVLPGLGLADRGGALRANFGRWDQRPGMKQAKVFQLWSHSGMSFPSPHRPERYGRLVFKEPASVVSP